MGDRIRCEGTWPVIMLVPRKKEISWKMEEATVPA